MNPTIQNLVDYAWKNKRGKAFVGWGPIEIGNAFVQAAYERLLLYSTNETGNIDGVVHCLRFGKTIFVVNVLTTSPGVFRKFVHRFKDLYPGFDLEATRHDKIKQYDTKRFVQKVTRSK